MSHCLSRHKSTVYNIILRYQCDIRSHYAKSGHSAFPSPRWIILMSVPVFLHHKIGQHSPCVHMRAHNWCSSTGVVCSKQSHRWRRTLASKRNRTCSTQPPPSTMVTVPALCDRVSTIDRGMIQHTTENITYRHRLYIKPEHVTTHNTFTNPTFLSPDVHLYWRQTVV